MTQILTTRWGIISTAKIGETAFIPSARQTPGAELVAVASRDQQKAADFAAKHDIPTAFGSYQELLDSPDIDAVYISLPNTMHAEWTKKAAAAGKHVFCEKPLTMTAAQGNEMVAACADAGVLLFEAFVFRRHPQSLRLRQILDAGEIGRLRHIDASMSFTINDYSNIRLIKELGGGSIWDGGVYPITFSRFVAGTDPISVQAMMRFDDKAGVDVWACLLLEYPDEVTSTIHCGFQGRGGPRALITGDAGKITVPSPYHPGPHSSFKVDGAENRSEKFETGTPPFQPAIEFFQQCIHGKQEPTDMADNAEGTLRVVEAAFKSARSGKRIDL
jgi:D-xylose 1-dehydrogenase (NADP+, D-xylono-1,5-lactone-forming)